MQTLILLIILLDVPSPPTGVRLANIKSRSLEISWIGPHDGNSPILNYVIEYSNLPGKTLVYISLFVVWNRLSLTSIY